MIRSTKPSGHKNLAKRLILTGVILSSPLLIGLVNPQSTSANPGGIEFIWDKDPNFVKLKGYQSSKEKMDHSTYFFFLRPRSRKTGILKLDIKVPTYFSSDIQTKRLRFCAAQYGGFKKRSKCLKVIPATISVNKEQTSIEVLPDQPIPLNDKTYALEMKVYNPRKVGMYQFHGYAQSSGSIPVSGYVGTWSFSVE